MLVSGKPSSEVPISLWDWHVHSLRVAVMKHLKDADEQSRAEEMWPASEPASGNNMPDETVGITAVQDEGSSCGNPELVGLIGQMLKDEQTLNQGLEQMNNDYSHRPEFMNLGYV